MIFNNPTKDDILPQASIDFEEIALQNHDNLNKGENVYNILSESLNYHPDKSITLIFPKKSNFYNYCMNYLLRIFIVIASIYSLYAFIRKRFSQIVICLTIIVWGTISTIAVLHTFDIIRYMVTFLPFIIIFFIIASFHFYQQMENSTIKTSTN